MFKAIKRFFLNLWRSLFNRKKNVLPIGETKDVEVIATNPKKYEGDMSTLPQIPLKLKIASIDPEAWFNTNVRYLIQSPYDTTTIENIVDVDEAVAKFIEQHEAKIVNDAEKNT